MLLSKTGPKHDHAYFSNAGILPSAILAHIRLHFLKQILSMVWGTKKSKGTFPTAILLQREELYGSELCRTVSLVLETVPGHWLQVQRVVSGLLYLAIKKEAILLCYTALLHLC